jgi:DNA-binding MarR family transcriptional regulator
MKVFEALFEIYDRNSLEILKSRLSHTSLDHLTFSHYEYLDRIYQMINPTLSELADDMKLSKPSVTVMVNKLIKEGLVEKVQDDVDKRVFHVQLTKLGHDVISIEKDAFMELTKEILNKLNDTEKETLMALLQKAVD